MIKSLKKYLKVLNKKIVITVFMLLLLSTVISFTELFIIDPSFDAVTSNYLAAIALVALTFLLNLTLYIYVLNNHKNDRHIGRTLGLIFTSLSITVLFSFIMKEYVNNYAMPIALCGIILVLLTDKRIALFSTVISAQIVFVTYSVTAAYLINSAALSDAMAVVTTLASGLFIVYFITQSYTRYKLIMISLIMGFIMGLFAALSTTIALVTPPFITVLKSFLWTIAGNVIAISIALLILPLVEKAFGLVSNFTLMELCSFDNPILKRLQEEAPGTFNHSLVVGNLAEHCALAIGKNPALARAAAYYHDVGKLKNPEFFIENQRDGKNPHDELIPEVSVRMITQHTEEGYKILNSNNFPKIIGDVAREHHGDSPLQFFYFKAQNMTEGKLGSEQFRYKDPKPHTATAAIVMIADIVEATSRTKGAMSSEEIKKLVDNLIKDKISLGQFDECDITMNDLNIIKKTIVNVLPGIYHGRLSYPENK